MSMGYWGNHRRSKDIREATDSETPQGKDRQRLFRRRNQPRDALGRFRKEGRDDEFAGGHGEHVELDGEAARKPNWRDFELDSELPRTPARDVGAPGGPADGRRHCGPLEGILFRQWSVDAGPPSVDVVRAVESLAELPERLKQILAERLDGIYVGPGGVPSLDDMGH
jgi:hypothetical protein